MNYSEAFLWMAWTIMTGIFALVLYKHIKKEKDKKEPDSKGNSSTQLRTTNRTRKSKPVSAGKRAKASQRDNSIATQIPGVNHGNVNVFNITNYTLEAGKNLTGEQDVISKSGETQETTSCSEKKKPGAKVYFLCTEKDKKVLLLSEQRSMAQGDTLSRQHQR